MSGATPSPDDDIHFDVTAKLYAVATNWFLEVVGKIAPPQWEEPGLGEWTVRELVGHTGRALSTTLDYLVDGAEATDLDVEIDDVIEYYRVALVDPTVHATVAERGRVAGEALGGDPVGTVRSLADRVIGAVDAASDDAKCRTFAGVMWLPDYLDSRIVELVLHTLDLCAATGQPLLPPAGPAQRTLDILATLIRPEQRGAALLALAGRSPLPDGFSAIG